MPAYYAHSAEEGPWETIEAHHSLVVSTIEKITQGIPGIEWARLAGHWHDLGKYSSEFQEYLKIVSASDDASKRLRGSVDHASAGAQWACQKNKISGRILAYLICGHHGGLPDHEDLDRRLKKIIPDWQPQAPVETTEQPLPSPPDLGRLNEQKRAAFRVAFWIRMLFSSLVDADYLATEAFCTPERATVRRMSPPSLPILREALVNYAEAKRTHLVKLDLPINTLRNNILSTCIDAAGRAKGFHSLCVPTGGGKTLSGMFFALNHAIANDMRRVIVAIPFTSIIEQNAEVYRRVFATTSDHAVLEHHCNLDPKDESDENRLQSENWDAPIIVTTSLQLLESLFESSPRRCRKLHRLAGSVIIFDEIQALPVTFLHPTLLALRELVEVYGCSIVLSSATIPAVHRTDDFLIGLEITPIIPDASALYTQMQRVEITVEETIEDEDLSRRLLGEPQVLCIVNTRAHAATLAGKLGPDDGHYHLSTRMCGAHRIETIEAIKSKLRKGETCRVVSTQLIEAGVDLDFPAVYRARCGLDSLAQAAGRCNREWKMEKGRVIFFATEKEPPAGELRRGAAHAEEIMNSVPADKLLSLEAIQRYFRLHYFMQKDQWDAKDVLGAAGNNPNSLNFQFKEMAARYQLIPDSGESLLIPWGDEGVELVGKLRKSVVPDREIFRSLQRYVVTVRENELRRLQDIGFIDSIHERWVLNDITAYCPQLGLKAEIELLQRDLVI